MDEDKCTTGFPFLPRLVVITTTPFAALEPYSEEAAASFKIVMVSISAGFSVFIMLLEPINEPLRLPWSPEIMGTPSITYNGSLLALMEPTPLMRMLGVAPASPLEEVTCTPAALPTRAFWKDVEGTSLISLCLITEAAPK